jgi:hypothetical protein
MTESIKRYKCPQCENVSDGTGLAAHMKAREHFGDRIPQPDGRSGDMMPYSRIAGKVAKKRAPAKAVASPEATVAAIDSQIMAPPSSNSDDATEFTIRVDERGVWLKLDAAELDRLLGTVRHGR